MKKVCMLLMLVFGAVVFTGTSIQAYDEVAGRMAEDERPKLMRVAEETSTFSTTISNPISIEEFISEVNLKAVDEIDGDLTDKISFEAQAYDESVLQQDEENRQLGEYPITFTVKDHSNNTAQCVLLLQVIDDEPPVLDKDQSILKYYLEVKEDYLTIDEIIANLHVTDNHSLHYEIISDEYTGNEEICGGYPVSIRFYDDSDNGIFVHVSIHVVDRIAPVITSLRTHVEVSYNQPWDIEDLVGDCVIEVTDNYYTNLTYSIFSDPYTENSNIIGEYEIKLQAIDHSGNESFYSIFVKVIDDVAPIFYLNETIVSTTTSNFLTKEDYKQILVKRHLVREENFEIEVIEDKYEIQKDKTGRYEVGLKVTYEDDSVQYQKIIVEVVELAETNNSFFAKVWQWMKKIFQMIWNILSWPFEQLFGLF